VVLVQRHDIPTVDFNLQFNAGFATDKPGKLGLAAFTAAMLNKGTDRYSATQLQNRAETLGASLSTDTNLTTTRIQLSALKQNLPASLALYADYILHPAFKQPAIDQLKSLWLAGIKDEKAGSQSLAWRLLPKLLYGSGNPYAKPLSGNGTLAAIEGLKRSDLLDFQRTWLRPDNATLIVVGDTNLTQLLPQLEKVFAGWQAPATPLPRLQLTEQPLPDSSRVYLVNKPGAEQSAIFAAQLVPAQQAKEELAIKAANSIIGGSISARLSQNLREQKNWSYGVYSQYVNPKGQGFWLVDAPVQTDKTAPAIEQILQEYRAYVSNRPATASELARFKKSARSAVPASLETSSALLAQVSHIVAKNRLDNYLETYLQQVKDETLTEVRTAAVDTFKSRQLTWLIIGDLAKIEPGIKKLGLGPVTVLNAEGQPQSGK
jgi:predicted Zn-dependent peptidase